MKALLAALLLCAVAWSEEPEKTFPEAEFDSVDVAALKAGEWVEREMFVEWAGDDGKPVKAGHNLSRMACVKADKDKVWIEESFWEAKEKAPERVTLSEVDRKTRKVVKAWESLKGATGTELKVKPAEDKKEANPGGNGAATQTVVADTLKIGAKDVACHALKSEEFHPGKGGKTEKESVSLWFSADVPFHERLDDPAVRKDIRIPDGMSKDLKTGQARVQVKIDSDDGKKSTRRVTGFGTDAKPTVTVK